LEYIYSYIESKYNILYLMLSFEQLKLSYFQTYIIIYFVSSVLH